MIGKLLGWLRGRREPAPIPDCLWQSVVSALPFLAALDDAEQNRLRHLAEDFLAEKEFAAAGGLTLSDEICVSIAAQGCLPILELGLDYYRGWVGVVVYADEFLIPRSVEDEFGVVHEYQELASGEAWSGGPLLVSWRDAQMAGSGYNVVIHEFAHKLDMLDGETDGIPPLPPDIPRSHWQRILETSYHDFCERVDTAEALGREAQFDPYASENPGEFFAVMSEAFFETPATLRSAYPELYDQFARFYRQDPAARLRPHRGRP
ncbi:MAG TPA: zinc-dependent peptidase [Accumulibacter sp.]|uniref:M90 family metallopeptidase n=1 Tax=Accumulibacter sp. TaxID=2053492 RepID=UPI0025E404C7|nr:M90 family metallopeptidase [Accumulibacter sp.]MCM8599769.1 zinc-dependent peptidase [Accumulibacter sp.]MCM8663860.1 zinc-dependent peptidase [Accumulibacter sp.]HNC51342.1 zinc-dependent peptidase [Accumulibacter sp.]